MINQHFELLIRNKFPSSISSGQDKAITAFVDFFFGRSSASVFLLKGYAGTGKTTLVAAFVEALRAMEQSFVLLAPTGRAAKVLSSYAHASAYTIHKHIYRQKTGGVEEVFDLGFNKARNTVYFVDEASMISNAGTESGFGSGRLLDDLMAFVYNGQNNRLVLIGDQAQLPPIGVEISPSLDADELRAAYNLDVVQVVLTEVIRQAVDSGILFNATSIRNCIGIGEHPIFKIKGFSDIIRIDGSEVLECIENCYGKYGVDETMVICRSNKRANRFNEGIRQRILYMEEDFCNGDRIMVVKNNYHCIKNVDGIDFIANGEIATVKRAGRRADLYGFHFAACSLMLDSEEIEIDAQVILDTLTSESPALSYEQQVSLFRAVEEDYNGIKAKKKRYEEIKENAYYNALQIKFAYAITGHKSQGGQWEAVVIDQGWLPEEMQNDDYWRWLYTAVTRGKKRVYLLNFNDEFFTE